MTRSSTDEFGCKKGCRSGQGADNGDFYRACQNGLTGDLALEVAEEEKADDSDAGGDLQPFQRGMGKEVGQQGDYAADYIGEADGDGTDASPVGIRFFQTKLIFHHEFDPF